MSFKNKIKYKIREWIDIKNELDQVWYAIGKINEKIYVAKPIEDEDLTAELNRLEIQLRIKRVREQLNKDGGEAKVTRWTDVKKKTGTL